MESRVDLGAQVTVAVADISVWCARLGERECSRSFLCVTAAKLQKHDDGSPARRRVDEKQWEAGQLSRSRFEPMTSSVPLGQISTTASR